MNKHTHVYAPNVSNWCEGCGDTHEEEDRGISPGRTYKVVQGTEVILVGSLREAFDKRSKLQHAEIFALENGVTYELSQSEKVTLSSYR